MNILAYQREMRSTFLGGFAGQLVSGLIWLVVAALGTWLAPVAGGVSGKSQALIQFFRGLRVLDPEA